MDRGWKRERKGGRSGDGLADLESFEDWSQDGELGGQQLGGRASLEEERQHHQAATGNDQADQEEGARPFHHSEDALYESLLRLMVRRRDLV